MEGGGRGRHGRGLSRGLPPAGLGRPEGERKPPLPRLWGGSLPRRACGYSSGEIAPREADDLPLNFRVWSGAPWRAKLLRWLPEALHKVHTRRSLPSPFHLNTGDRG